MTRIAETSIVRVRDDVVSRVLGDEVVILALDSGMYFGLDAVGTRVWELIADRRNVGAILQSLVAEYDIDPVRCAQELFQLLEELHGKGLIDVADANGG